MQIEDIPRFKLTKDVFDSQVRLQMMMESCRSIEKKLMLRLAKTSMIRSVNSSLAIEGNGMKPYEVMDLLEGRTVIAPFDELVETRNALDAYRRIDEFETWSVKGLLEAHDAIMFGLVETPGFRNHPVGVFDGEKLIYKAPDHGLVADMTGKLLDWGKESQLPASITGAIVHFYIESIHPFPDGNGRMGRLWNSKILHDSDRLFDIVSMESGIRDRRDEYYEVLERCQSSERQDCTEFIVFCIDCLTDQFGKLRRTDDPAMSRLLDAMTDAPMTSNEIMSIMGLSHKPSFMKTYMEPALRAGLVARTEDSLRSRNQRYRRLIERLRCMSDDLLRFDHRSDHRQSYTRRTVEVGMEDVAGKKQIAFNP